MEHRAATSGEDGGDSASAALDTLLQGNPDALVAAMGTGGRLVPVPASVPLHGQMVFSGRVAMELFVLDDRRDVVDAWMLAQSRPIVGLDVHVVSDPAHRSTVHFFDVRDDHGIHLVVLETRDPHGVLGSGAGLEAAPRHVAHIRRNAESVFVDVDVATSTLLGWSRDELVGRPTLELVHPEDASNAIEGWLAMRTAGADDIRSTVRLRHRDGHYVWLEVTNNNHLDDPEIGCVLSRLVDITEPMAELEALHARERLLHRLADTLPIGICHLRPDGRVMHTNSPLVAMLGPVDSVEALATSVAPIDRSLVRRAIEQALEGRSVDLEIGVLNGFEERRCELTVRTMTNDDDGVDGVVVSATDVTDRSRLRSELEHRASHDALSGCLNRAATVTALERALRTYPHVVVAYIDLDDFKSVNDELGHAAGDELLRVAAARLRNVVRSQDRLGRIGGDEFAVICPQMGTPFEADALADRLTDAIGGVVTFARQRIPLNASVGIAASIPGDEDDAEALLSRADAAMYAVKRSGRVRPGLRDLSAG